MQIQVLNEVGSLNDSIQVSPEVFERDYNEGLVHQVVVAYQANARSGNRKQKDRAEVRHSTKKPWRQKGTGRARAGMVSSPIWRGGGRTFPNSPEENFSQKVNRKMFRVAMCSIYSRLLALGRLQAVKDFSLAAPKTKIFAEKIKSMGLRSVLLITDHVDEALYLASRNLPHVSVVEPRYVDPLSLLSYEKVLVTEAAIPHIERLLK
jgi:large subunit ribosomal protein L4